jgi:phosphatidylglycerol:prolipoprotein diacylglycerol transferase
MLVHPQFDPIAFQIGPVAVRWYGLMYLAAFVLVIVLGRIRARQQMLTGWRLTDVDDMLFLGVLIALWIFARRRNKAWLDVTDFVAPLCPLGLGAGRLGNFINGELVGRPTEGPWAMIFPQVDNVPRHPSQLYELGLEGLLLFAILWMYSSRQRPRGAVSGLFLVGYGTFRFIGEFAREPDSFLGFLAGGLTMGQWLSLPMVVAGLVMMRWAYRRAGKHEPTLLDRMKG